MFEDDGFENGYVTFRIESSPVSLQSNAAKRKRFKKSVQDIVKKSELIFTEHVHVAIDWFCSPVARLKNPSIYDIDNITKPILDAIIGPEGILLDDVQVNRITTNWIDTYEQEHIEVEVKSLDGLYARKQDLVIIKFKSSGFCFPFPGKMDDEDLKIISHFHRLWCSIKTHDDYIKARGMLPMQPFFFHTKIAQSGFKVIELD